MTGSHIERKHFRIHFCRADRFVPHQTLQHLQRNSRVQHVHGVGVAERVRNDRYGERHTVGSCRFHGFAQQGADRPVGDLPDACLLCLAGSLIAALQWNFQGGNHHLQLADVLMIGKRNQPVWLAASRRTTGRSGRFLRALHEGGQLHKRVGRLKGEIPPCQPQRLINTRPGIPQGCQQHLAVQIGHVVEQGAHFRGQQVFRQFVLDQGHLAKGLRSRVINSDRKLTRRVMHYRCG